MTDMTQPKPKQYGRPDNERVIPFMKIAKPRQFSRSCSPWPVSSLL